jgi:hypothetical protein
MASLSKIIDVHSHPVLAFGERAPVTDGKQPDWSVESALSLWRSTTSPHACFPLLP